jgi:hypothetical protein
MRSNVSRHQLLLSVAAVAVLSGPAFAADSIDCDTTSIYTCVTSSLTDPLKTSVKKNIMVMDELVTADSEAETEYDGKIALSKANAAILTIDSDNVVYVNHTMYNHDASGASAIKIDLSSDRTAAAWSYDNYSSSAVSGAAVYIDTSGYISLYGKGTNKRGIWLDSSSASDGTGTLTGDIIALTGSTLYIKGDGSYGIYVDSGTTMQGIAANDGLATLNFGGTMTIYQSTVSNRKVSSGIVGIKMDGYLDGDFLIGSGGKIAVTGQGAQGIVIAGSGISGSMTIAGSVVTAGIDSSSASSITNSYYYGSDSSSTRTYAEGGDGVVINSDIGKGFLIAGARYSNDSSYSAASISATSAGSAILISPSDVANATGHLVIGAYQTRTLGEGSQYSGDYDYDEYVPGFGFLNRGSVSIAPANTARTDQTVSVSAIDIVGGTSRDTATIITGGIYNSGSVSAAASTYDEDATATVYAIKLDNYVYLNGDYNSTSGTYADDYTYSCAPNSGNGVTTCTLTGTGDALGEKLDDDQYALVNSVEANGGSISSSVSGNGGGIAYGIYIGKNSVLTSLYNSGTISATAESSYTDITMALEAYAIKDESGTLTFINNSGTISASATTLDDASQIGNAIDLSAVTAGMTAYNGVTIVSQAEATRAAVITGEIVFGDGNNQKIYLSGAGTGYNSTITGNIKFGSNGCDITTSTVACASNDLLSIGAFSTVTGEITAASGADVLIYNNGTLSLTNDKTSGAFYADDVHAKYGGYLSIAVSRSSGLNEAGVIRAKTVEIDEGAHMGATYRSYIDNGEYVLVSSTEGMDVEDLATYSNAVAKPVSAAGGAKPYLFKTSSLTTKFYDASGLISSCTGQASCSSTGQTRQELVLSVTTKTKSELGLTGYANAMFERVNEALEIDDDLGSAMVNGIHADADDTNDTKGTSKEAQAAYNSYAPNVTDGTRAIALSITDQATGVVGARQRSLRMYANQSGEMTLWAQEFVQMIKTPGQGAQQVDGSYEKNGFRDHGFGVVLGLDAGDKHNGWFGGALTFYNGDVSEIDRPSHNNSLWVIATGYGSWRGRGFFLDGKVDLGYAHIKGERWITLTGTSSSYARVADNSHAAALISGGLTTGAVFTWGALVFSPQVSLDGMFLREDGYVENNPLTRTKSNDGRNYGDGFDLNVMPTETRSLRTFVGGNLRYDINFDGIYLQPEVRLGYRYDFLTQPITVRSAFKDLDPNTSGNQTGTWFSLTGPDPNKGAFVAGGSLGATSGDWSINMHFDFLRGDDGMLEEVGTVNLIGRL